jgi:hypothetical protein
LPGSSVFHAIPELSDHPIGNSSPTAAPFWETPRHCGQKSLAAVNDGGPASAAIAEKMHQWLFRMVDVCSVSGGDLPAKTDAS